MQYTLSFLFVYYCEGNCSIFAVLRKRNKYYEVITANLSLGHTSDRHNFKYIKKYDIYAREKDYPAFSLCLAWLSLLSKI